MPRISSRRRASQNTLSVSLLLRRSVAVVGLLLVRSVSIVCLLLVMLWLIANRFVFIRCLTICHRVTGGLFTADVLDLTSLLVLAALEEEEDDAEHDNDDDNDNDDSDDRTDWELLFSFLDFDFGFGESFSDGHSQEKERCESTCERHVWWRDCDVLMLVLIL
jgi:hypothetical protein